LIALAGGPADLWLRELAPAGTPMPIASPAAAAGLAVALLGWLTALAVALLRRR
jgi:hypothetical protein